MQAKRPYKADLSFRKFLENDRHVLRFYCIWDDRNSMFGDKRKLVNIKMKFININYKIINIYLYIIFYNKYFKY